MSTGGAEQLQRGAVRDQMGVVVVGFDDMLRAEQAAGAADFWRRANRNLPIGPITVVGRTLSGSVAVRTRGFVRPRGGARRGFLIGLGLVGLPAAGIAGFVGWLLGAVVTGLLSLTGLIGGDNATVATIALAVGFAVVGGLLIGLVGALLGAGIGAIVGVIDSRMHGIAGSKVGAMAADVPAGKAIVAISAGVETAPLVTDELLRLGGVPRTHPAPSQQVVSTEEAAADVKGSGRTDVASN